jgi:predicted metal-dependent hydrolase
MVVNAPLKASEEELQKIVVSFKKRFERKELRKELQKRQSLKEIAEKLNREYFGGRLVINSIEYSVHQDRRFGCCHFRTGRILISHRLAQMPDWVRDYVIIHELAHLLVPNHSKAFHGLVARYKLSERAKGFLIAKGYEEQEMESGDAAETTEFYP